MLGDLLKRGQESPAPVRFRMALSAIPPLFVVLLAVIPAQAVWPTYFGALIAGALLILFEQTWPPTKRAIAMAIYVVAMGLVLFLAAIVVMVARFGIIH